MKRYVLVILAALCLVACGRASAEEDEVTCTVEPIKADAAQEGIDDGAVVVYERRGGSECINEVWNIYPDGRIVGENGSTKVEEKVSPDDVAALLDFAEEEEFFELWDTEHTACASCYTYYITIKSGDQVLTVKAVDGGTDTPGAYWNVWAEIKKLLPEFSEE